MSVQAKIVEPWLLDDLDVRCRTIARVQTNIETKKNICWLEQVDHFILSMRRHFIGLNGFQDEAGNQSTGGFQLYVGNGKSYSFSRTSGKPGNPKWICTSNRLQITDHITGEGWEIQVWELQSAPQMVPGSYYEMPLTT